MQKSLTREPKRQPALALYPTILNGALAVVPGLKPTP
jgi:hypothetical protein